MLAQTVEELADELDPLIDACGAEPSTGCEWIFDLTDSRWAARVVDWLLGAPLSILVILVGASLLTRIVRRLIREFAGRIVADRKERIAKREQEQLAEQPVVTDELPVLQRHARRLLREDDEALERSARRADTLSTVLVSVAVIAIWGVAIAMVISELGLDIAPLIAGAGVAGLAIGFGAQTLVRDFLSGMFILFEDQYGVGDVVDLGEAVGVVEEVQLRITRVRGLDGTLWTVPNGEITRVANHTQLWARAILDIEVAYDTDLDLAERIIKESADHVWHLNDPEMDVLEEPQIWGVEMFGENSIAIRVVLRTEAGHQWTVSRAVRKEVKRRFDEAGIEIPFPQRVVWSRTESVSDEEPAASGGE